MSTETGVLGGAVVPIDNPLLVPTIRGRRELAAHARQHASIAVRPDGYVVPMSYAAVNSLLRDRRLSGLGSGYLVATGVTDGPIIDHARGNLLMLDGDPHQRLRRLVAKGFTPGSVEALRPFVRSTISGLVDAVEAEGRCDAVEAICTPYPVPVICEMLGIPRRHWATISRLVPDVFLMLRPDAVRFRAIIEAALVELDVIVDAAIAQAQLIDADTLLARLLEAEDDGDRLSRAELRGLVSLLLQAGTDTTRHQLGLMLHTFAEHPDQWALVRERPELIPQAVEEAIRWVPSLMTAPRVVTEDIEIDGALLPAGTRMSLLTLSANHDELALADPDRFDITRVPPPGWHLHTFGGGVHYCLGASLARLELQEALAELSSRFGELHLDGEPGLPHPGNIIWGFTSLPIRWR